ncbi:uncharacterized protein FA14DRAFT_162167 [Meira miltonrushii]|uniref:Uncharacterized protein n=1 Tax=Meira miltonrushii TaxID=1280837 RepID=A0A316VBQ3_9BASI|nr:uncharacterized protein FA14DRAFT_162167 [Meira miltonrushii]PWN32985.1 hypothetical protein FA14DRAFT_162167 [Meira miltonrushii]
MAMEIDTSMAEAQPMTNTNGSSQQDSDTSIQKANALASSLFQNANIKIIARAIDQTLKALLIQIGIAIRARVRLNNVLESIKTRIQFQADIPANVTTNPSSLFSGEELIILQQFGLQPEKIILSSQSGIPINIGKTVPNYEALERECVRYRALTSQLAFIVDHARHSLQSALPQALEREAKQQEEQRIKDQLAAAEAAEAQRIKDEQAAKAAEEAAAKQAQSAPAPAAKEGGDAIVLDDDDEDDDVPLAGKPTNANSSSNNNDAIDLTDESPANKVVPLPATSTVVPASEPSTGALPTDPAALLAQLTAAVSGSSTFASNKDGQSTTTSQPSDGNALSNFDFSSFGLSNPMDTTANDKDASNPNTMDNMFGDIGTSLNMGYDGSNDAANGGLGDVNLLNFNPEQFEGVDLSFLNNLGGGSGDGGTSNNENDSNLLGNIDFSALLGGGGGGNGT